MRFRRTRHYISFEMGDFEMTIFNNVDNGRFDYWNELISKGIRFNLLYWQFWFVIHRKICANSNSGRPN